MYRSSNKPTVPVACLWCDFFEATSPVLADLTLAKWAECHENSNKDSLAELEAKIPSMELGADLEHQH